MRIRIAASCFALLLSLAAGAEAEAPADAMTTLFEMPHLDGLAAGDILVYGFSGQDLAGAPLVDTVAAHIQSVREDGRKDVGFDFLTGERRLDIAPFEGFRGNPLIMLTLEREVGRTARLTGLPADWLRNRIRAAFGTAVASDESIAFEGAALPAMRVELRPFAEDPMFAAVPLLAGKRYTVILADGVPGRIWRIETETPGPPGGPPAVETLTFERLEPSP